jgi:hypothetical protein
MIVKAECSQLENRGLFMNIINEEFSRLGVWTNIYSIVAVLYKTDNNIYFMTFKTARDRLEFETNQSIKLEILWDSES